MTNKIKVSVILHELIIRDFLPKLEKMLIDDLDEEIFFEDVFEDFKNQYKNLIKQNKSYKNSDQDISFEAFLIKNF